MLLTLKLRTSTFLNCLNTDTSVKSAPQQFSFLTWPMSETLVRAVIISSDNLTMVKGSTELDINSKDLSKNRLLGHILITVDSISHFILIVLHPITKRHCVLVKKFHNVPYRCCLIGHIFRTEFWLLIFVFCFLFLPVHESEWAVIACWSQGMLANARCMHFDVSVSFYISCLTRKNGAVLHLVCPADATGSVQWIFFLSWFLI